MAMNLDQEMRHLLELMPASGRMVTKIIPKSQKKVIHTPFPYPWNWETRPLYINFELWAQLRREERDLLLLRSVCWLVQVQWFKADIYQGLTIASGGALAWELFRGDVVGVLVAGGLGAIALKQIWQGARSEARELDADTQGLKVALRRGYGQQDGAQALHQAIIRLAQLEGNRELDFVELMRCQKLQEIARREGSV